MKVEDDSKLKPGMTVAVEIFLAKYKDVITVPVASVLEIDERFYCWIDIGGSSPEKREVVVQDSNDTFAAIKDGLKPGERVVLNPRDFVDEASVMALKSIRPTTAPADVPDFDASKSKGSNEKSADKKKKPTPKMTGASILEIADKNKDGVLTEDELDEKGKRDMKKNDSNGDGKLDEKELDARYSESNGGSEAEIAARCLTN